MDALNLVILTMQLVSWSNPTYQSGDTANYCREGLLPEDGLAWCELFVHRAPSYAPETLRVDIRGREGTRSQAWIDDRGERRAAGGVLQEADDA